MAEQERRPRSIGNRFSQETQYSVTPRVNRDVTSREAQARITNPDAHTPLQRLLLTEAEAIRRRLADALAHPEDVPQTATEEAAIAVHTQFAEAKGRGTMPWHVASEKELAEETGFSRPVVGAAVEQLRATGVVGRTRGVANRDYSIDYDYVPESPRDPRPYRQEFPSETPVTEIQAITFGTPPEVGKVMDSSSKEKDARPDPAAVNRARAIIGDTLDLTRAQKTVLNILLAIAQEGRMPTDSDYSRLEGICAQWEPRSPDYPRQGIDNLLGSVKRKLGEQGHIVTGEFADVDGNPHKGGKLPQIDLSTLSLEPSDVELVPFTPKAEASTQSSQEKTGVPREARIARNPEKTKNDQARVRELLGTGLTDREMAAQLNLTHSQVRYARRRLELDAVNNLFEEAEVIGSPLSEREAALQGAKNEFGRRLRELTAQLDSCTYGKYGPQYQEKARETAAEITRLKGDPFYTGVVNALRRMPVSDKPTVAEPTREGGVHLGYDEPPKFHRGDTPEQSFSDAGPGQGEQSFHEVFDRRNSRDNRFGR